MRKSLRCNKIFFLLLLCMIVTAAGKAQQLTGCATPTPQGAARLVPAGYNRPTDISNMLMIKLYIYVTRGEYPGLPPAQEEEEILAHFETMRQQFAAVGICFLLVGISEIVSDDLAYIDSESNTDFELVRSYALQRPDCLSVFIHNDIAGNVIGTAWDIPNTFVSLEGDYTWSGYDVLASHEIGHALGLLHTFEDYYGTELVNRTGSCSNCSTAGDLVCDTKADKNISNQYFNNNCQYIGGHIDSCSVTYQMEPDNTMSYNAFTACTYKFTTGQGDRMHYTIGSTPALINLTLISGYHTITNTLTYSSGNYTFPYKNYLTVNSPAYVVTGSAKMQITSTEITLMPGAQLAPTTTTGITVLRANPLCQ